MILQKQVLLQDQKQKLLPDSEAPVQAEAPAQAEAPVQAEGPVQAEPPAQAEAPFQAEVSPEVLPWLTPNKITID